MKNNRISLMLNSISLLPAIFIFVLLVRQTFSLSDPALFMIKMVHLCKTEKINVPEGFFHNKHLYIR